MLRGDEGDREAVCRPRGFGPLPDQAERIPSGDGGEKTLTPGIRY